MRHLLNRTTLITLCIMALATCTTLCQAATQAATEMQPEESMGLHHVLKTKFIEGNASFMSLVAIALVLKHKAHVSTFVALATHGHGSHVGRVGFKHNAA